MPGRGRSPTICLLLAAAFLSPSTQAQDASLWQQRMDEAGQAGKLRHFDEQEKALLAAIQIAETAEPDANHLTTSLESLASCYSAQYRREDAKPVIARAIVVADKIAPGSNPDLNHHLTTLARASENMGDPKTAEQLWRRILQMDITSFGIKSARVAMDEGEVALALEFQHDDSGAEDFYNQARATYALLNDTRGIAATLSRLSSLAILQHQYDKADEYVAAALEILKKDENLNASQIANTLLKRAQVAQDRHLPAEATEYTRQALAIQEAHSGADVPSVAGTKRALAQRMAKDGDLADAESLLVGAIQDEETSPRPDARKTEILDVEALGRIYMMAKKYSEAEIQIRRSMDLIVKEDGSQARGLAGPMADLASLREDQGRSAEAEAQYKATIAFIEKNDGILSFALDRVLRQYAWLLHTLGRKDEAQKLIARADEVRAAHIVSLPRSPSQD